MSDSSRQDRYADFYKFIATVDAAGLAGTLTLRQTLGLNENFGLGLILFGLSAYLCIFGMWTLTRNKVAEDARLRSVDKKTHKYLGLSIFFLTTGGVVSVILASIW